MWNTQNKSEILHLSSPLLVQMHVKKKEKESDASNLTQNKEWSILISISHISME